MSTSSSHKRRRHDHSPVSSRHSSSYDDYHGRPSSPAPPRHRPSQGSSGPHSRPATSAALNIAHSSTSSSHQRRGSYDDYDKSRKSTAYDRDKSGPSSRPVRSHNDYYDDRNGRSSVSSGSRDRERYPNGYISKDEEWAARAGAAADGRSGGLDRFSSSSRYTPPRPTENDGSLDSRRSASRANVYGATGRYGSDSALLAPYRYDKPSSRHARSPPQVRISQEASSIPDRRHLFDEAMVSSKTNTSSNRLRNGPSFEVQVTTGSISEYWDDRSDDYGARRQDDRRYDRDEARYGDTRYNSRYDDRTNDGGRYGQSSYDATGYYPTQQGYRPPPPSALDYSRTRRQFYEDYHPPPPEATILPPANGLAYGQHFPSRRSPPADDRSSEYAYKYESPVESRVSESKQRQPALEESASATKRRRTRFDVVPSQNDDSSTTVPSARKSEHDDQLLGRQINTRTAKSSADKIATLTKPSKGFKKTFFKIPSVKESIPRRSGFRRDGQNGSSTAQNGDIDQEREKSNGIDSMGRDDNAEQHNDTATLPDIERPKSSKGEERTGSIYERKAQVGEGTYGKVYKAVNTVTNEMVALKRIRMESERDGFPITALREIKLLQSVRHDNVVSLLEMMVEKSSVYMVFEYMDHDLSGILTHPNFLLEHAHIKHLFKQLLEGLAYLHKRGVLHRDIKASNILLSNSGQLKLADFGLARFYNKHKSTLDYTNRVITLWYRPPELLLGATVYDAAVDIWGAGCLMVEMYTRRAIFQGQDEIQQLEVIYDIMGTPSKTNWVDVERLPWYELIKPSHEREPQFRSMFESVVPPAGLELAVQLLSLDPTKRPSAAAALESDYFTKEAPAPVRPTGLGGIEGEWHEYQSKQRRRKEKSQQNKGSDADKRQ
ncbi:kinase-like domain-containing protein [Lipomyces kononenkoae]|uniref:Kinase-like domain-containing protein n=1 Tax=Lipomyces kononenkoae TaxID=34357 RepID=A0ACC3SVY3_LIPKO